MSRFFSIALPALALAFLAFLYGIAVMRFEWPPYPLVADLDAGLSDLAENWQNDLGVSPTRHLQPAHHPGTGVVTLDTARKAPGLTLLAGIFADEIDTVAARLIAADGTVVNHWPVRYTELFPDLEFHPGEAEDVPLTDWNVFLHGMLALPDGSIVFNFDGGRALIRMDRCATPLWILPGDYHHSVHLADDGTLWMPKDYFALAQVNQAGEELRHIDMRAVFERQDLLGLFEIQHRGAGDRYHMNDVEVLSAELASAFPQFQAGDLAISLRSLNMILVLRPATEEVVWFMHGPWHRQHDPDFLPDGRIAVFDNRWHFPPSRLLAVDPQSRRVDVLYDQPADGPYFHTEIRGKHEFLDNGNILVTDAQSGRVFEITRDGTIVWDFVNRYDTDRVAVISNARRYPPGYFEVTDWSCQEG